MVEKEIGKEYNQEIILFISHEVMQFRERKERQRIQLFDRNNYFGKNATLLEIGTGDGIFATWIKNIYGYRLWGYDIQHMLSRYTQLDYYEVGGEKTLLHMLNTQKFDGIIIAYTLHHMQDKQITQLLSLLHSYQIPIIILEETYIRTKLFVSLNDIISNILQYGFWKFNRRMYFQLNFKTVSSRNILFQNAGYTPKTIGKKVRYGYFVLMYFFSPPQNNFPLQLNLNTMYTSVLSAYFGVHV